MAVALLWLNGLGFLAFGLIGLVSPATTLNLVGFDPLRPDAIAEVYAQYGGLFVGIGIFGLFGAFKRHLQHPSMLLMLLIYLGLGGGRLLGVFTLDGEAGSYTLGALGFELIMAALLGAALYLPSHSSPSASPSPSERLSQQPSQQPPQQPSQHTPKSSVSP
tara:strand:+ start:7012 stop:7497 length:486 start_codon:yes stop_codon:yes gene_type:complete